VGASLGQLAGLQLLDEVAHLLRRQRLAGADGGVTGEGGGDAALRVGGGVVARQEVQQLDEGARRVFAAQAGGRRAQQITAGAEGLDLKAVAAQGRRVDRDQRPLRRR
jgi:hypothetical protein